MANRPKVPGVLRLHLRERREEPAGSGDVKIVERTVDWNVAETAIIVCDMWDDHHCKIAAQRVGVMAPRMNQVLTAARDRGVMIIHAPSETMNVYAGTPYRMRMERAKPAMPPVPIERRCDVDPTREPRRCRSIARSTATTPSLGPDGPQHTRQHAAIDIIGFDGVSDDGREIYNFCEQEGIKNIVLMGVHTNYCVLGRLVRHPADGAAGEERRPGPRPDRRPLRPATTAVCQPRPRHRDGRRARRAILVSVDPRRRPDPRRAGLRRADRGDTARPGEAPISVPRPLEVLRAAQSRLRRSPRSWSSARLRPCRPGPGIDRGPLHQARIPDPDARRRAAVHGRLRAEGYDADLPPADDRTQSGVLPYGVDNTPSVLGPSPFFGQGGLHLRLPGRARPLDVGRDVRQHAAARPARTGPQDVDESTDTYDTIDWLVKNVANHNGKVGHVRASPTPASTRPRA